MDKQPLEIEVADGIAWLRLNRGVRLNALTWDMLRLLTTAFEELEDDDRIRASVLIGSDGTFCAGADIEMMATLSLEEFRGFCEDIQQLTRIIRRLSFPVIAAVDGVAVGAGCEIACLCDMRVGTDRVRMGFPEAGVGLVVTSGASWLLPRLVGTGWARRLLFTAQLVDAHLAERIGLLDEVVPQGELEERSAEIANRVASQSPAAIDAARGLQNLAESGDIESALQGEVDLIAKLKAGDEAAEGLTSFLERRKPRWANKLAERGQV